MTWRFDQSSGELSRDGKFISRAYAGHGWGKNNPAAEAAPNIGPIPRGLWTICEPHDSPNTGPYTMDLTPKDGTDTLGRSAFRIHGDSIAHPGEASHGCIIAAHAIRTAIWTSEDHDLEVVE